MSIYKTRLTNLLGSLTHEGTLLHPSVFLQRAARLWPDRQALICEDATITYNQLYTDAVEIAQKIRQRGIKPGNRILLLYENSINFYRAYHGAWMAGAIVAPLNVFLKPPELQHIYTDAQPALIITSPAQEEKLAGIVPPERVWSTDFSGPSRTGNERAGKTSEYIIPHPPLGACTVLLYTSGTTGLPKGVMLTGNNIITNCTQGIANFNFTEQERIYAALPLFHSYMQNAAVWCPLIVGALTILIPRITRRSLLQGLTHKPSIVLGIPPLYGLFCLMKDVPFNGIKLFISGGDALNSTTRMYFELLYGRKIANGYGLTETSPLISAQLEDYHAPIGCVGKPFAGITITITGEQGMPVPTGTIGTILVSGGNVMKGYYNAPAATADVLQDSLLNTGDLGYIDTDGSLIITGRAKDLIVNKGIKIYPQEIENILTQHPAVMAAAVVGMQTEDQEVPVAFVAASTATPELEQELKALCQKVLADYKVPRAFFVRKELPTTTTGKIDKKALRQELASCYQK
jgi:long-chain acyl-CoA synthetase